MNVQNVSTVPSHIDDFIKGNLDQLNKIHKEGYDLLGDGVLVLNVKNQRIKWMLNIWVKKKIIYSLTKENWEQIKIQRGEKNYF